MDLEENASWDFTKNTIVKKERDLVGTWRLIRDWSYLLTFRQIPSWKLQGSRKRVQDKSAIHWHIADLDRFKLVGLDCPGPAKSADCKAPLSVRICFALLFALLGLKCQIQSWKLQGSRNFKAQERDRPFTFLGRYQCVAPFQHANRWGYGQSTVPPPPSSQPLQKKLASLKESWLNNTIRKVDSQLQSRIRLHVPKDSILIYNCVPRKLKRQSKPNADIRHLLDFLVSCPGSLRHRV